MLESGARASLRHAQRAKSSRRLLHSAFWCHGATELEAHTITPCTRSHRQDEEKNKAAERKRREELLSVVTKICNGLVLDFLIPPQTLAWASWESRNARRLPKGFIQTRGYSSQAGDASAVSSVLDEDSSTAPKDEAYPIFPGASHLKTTRDQHPITSLQHEQNNMTTPQIVTEPQHATTAITSVSDLVSSNENSTTDGEIADALSSVQVVSPGYDTSQSILSLIRSACQEIGGIQPRHIERAWQMYQGIDVEAIHHTTLEPIIKFFADHESSDAQNHVMQIYNDIPVGSRTLPIYKAAFDTFLELGLHGLTEQCYREAVSQVDGTESLSVSYLCHAHKRMDWDLAYRIKQQLQFGTHDFSEAVIDRKVYQTLVYEPDFVEKGISLVKHIRTLQSTNMLSPGFISFSVNALTHITIEHLRAHDNILKRAPGVPDLRQSPRNRYTMLYYIRSMLRVFLPAEQTAAYLSAVLEAITEPRSVIDFEATMPLVEQFFQTLGEVSTPAEKLLSMLVKRSLMQEEVQRVDKESSQIPLSLEHQHIIDAWRKHHGNISLSGVGMMLRDAVDRNDRKSLEYWTKRIPKCPLNERIELMATQVEYNAKHVSIRGTEEAFEQIAALCKDGLVTNARCWHALIEAYARAGNTVGAQEVLDRMFAQTCPWPTAETILPILMTSARAGMPDQVKSILAKYRSGLEDPDVVSLHTALLEAHIYNNDVDRAAQYLKDELLPAHEAGTIHGDLTGAFNVVLSGQGKKRGVIPTMQTYRLMQKHNVQPDAATFASILEAFVNSRMTNGARRILESVMPAAGIIPDARHYGLLMSGYVMTNQGDTAIDMYEIMRRRRILPDDFTLGVLQKAKFQHWFLSQRQYSGLHLSRLTSRSSVDSMPISKYLKTKDATGADAEMRNRSASSIPIILEQLGQLTYNGVTPESEALEEDLLAILSKARSLRGWTKLHTSSVLAMDMLDALMSMYTQQRRFEPVYRCWELAQKIADKRRAKHPISSTGLANGSSRFLLDRHLKWALTAMRKRNDHDAILSTITTMFEKGYDFESPTWNTIVQSTIRVDPPLTLLGYSLTEQHLVKSFTGWKANARTVYSDYRARSEHMLPTHLEQRDKQIQYDTVVALRGALRVVQNEAFRQSRDPYDPLDQYIGSPYRINQAAPRTFEMVMTMPYEHQGFQERFRARTTPADSAARRRMEADNKAEAALVHQKRNEQMGLNI